MENQVSNTGTELLVETHGPSDAGPSENEMPDADAINARVHSGEARHDAEAAFGGHAVGATPPPASPRHNVGVAGPGPHPHGAPRDDHDPHRRHDVGEMVNTMVHNPLALVQQLSDEVDKVFEGFGLGRSNLTEMARRSPLSPTRALSALTSPLNIPSPLTIPSALTAWSPSIEVSEENGNIVLHADLPGVKREDVRVHVENGVLSISGERKQKTQGSHGGVVHSERAYGRFQRSFTLPEGVNSNSVKARFQDGVLEVTVPSPKTRSGAHQVEIQ